MRTIFNTCKIPFTIVVMTMFCHLCGAQNIASTNSIIVPMADVERGFKTIPDSIQTSVYWYWISDNISKQGVIKDLESMKAVGINRAFIGNIGISETTYGKVKLFTPEWWDIMHTALKTATKLNIEIGIFNSPGWSQSGGPWVKPGQSMRYLTSSEISVKGPFKFDKKLAMPADNFQDVQVLAYPTPQEFNNVLKGEVITSEPAVANLQYLTDGNEATVVDLPSGQNLTLTMNAVKDYTLRSITLLTAHKMMRFEGDVQVKNGEQYTTIRHFTVDRSNIALNTGFLPFGPAVITVPATTSKSFRIVFSNASPGSSLGDIKLSSSPRIENYVEKTLGKMYPTPLPYWKEYQWATQPPVDNSKYVIDPGKVIDITKYMAADGTLNWDVPAGEWIIMRSGMTPTGVVNSPASPEGTGRETDKMSKEHIAQHFDAFLGEIMRRIPAEDRKTWKYTVEDSYETGSQNWTDNMAPKFKARFGYDPMQYIPVISGEVVGSEDQSDRFLWDLRRFIADEVSYQYVAGLRDVSHEHGLSTWLECYGHWGFPSEFLQYGGQSDEVAGEFWSEGELGNIENRAASSCAHIYGKNKVSAESFTCGGAAYSRYPATMKQRGDRFFTEGINNTLLHLYIEQPYDDKLPGVNAPFSNEFNRLNTWYYDMDLFTNYLKRCNFMLRQGNYVADVAYFIGEDAPKMTGIRDPELPQGYAYDYINAEVIQERATVADGKLVLPGGMAYKILVLPKLETMRPELLKKIMELVEQGAVVLGPAPKRSPSLQNFGQADAEVQKMAAALWGDIDGATVKVHQYGKGMVINGMDMQQALDLIKTIPDCKFSDNDTALYIHRKLNDGDLYFVSNQTNRELFITPQFRVMGKIPELWDPVTTSSRNLPSYNQNGNVTSVPLKLDAFGSAFIVFRKQGSNASPVQLSANYPDPQKVDQIQTPWVVNFDAKRWGPVNPVIFDKLTDWALSAEDSIKHYSGTAVYHNSFKISKIIKGQHVFLDLGTVRAMAKVKINGVEAGGVWTAPYRLDISSYIKKGNNIIEVALVNTWVNRLVGDLGLPADQRKTWSSVNPYNANSPLESSGLMGPVTIQYISY
jgi:hypothetical protein